MIFRLRDHREAEEGQREERRRADPPEPVRGLVARAALRDDLRERRVRQQAGDRERALGEHAAVVHGHDPAADLDQPLDRERHVLVRHADDDQVVGVVSDRRRERAAPEAGPRHEAEPDTAGREMPLDDGDLRQVALGIGDRQAAATPPARATSDSVTTWSVTSPIARMLDPFAVRPRSPPRDTGCMRTLCRTQSGISTGGASAIRRPRFSTVSGMKSTRSGRTSTSAR